MPSRSVPPCLQKHVQEKRRRRGGDDAFIVSPLGHGSGPWSRAMGKIAGAKRAVTFQPPLSDNVCFDKNRGWKARSGAKEDVIGQGFNWESISAKFQSMSINYF